MLKAFPGFLQKGPLMNNSGLFRTIPFVLPFFFFLKLYSDLGAQPIFSPGQVVLLNGDTLSGLVGELGYNKRHEKCIFKSSPKDKAITYFPSQIRAYSVDNRNYYQSRELDMEDGISARVFVAYYVKGGMELWRHKERYFLESAGLGIQEVLSNSGKGESDAEKIRLGNEKLKWFQFLSEVKTHCPQIEVVSEKLRELKYREEDLIEFASAYNDCRGNEFVLYSHNVPLVAVDIGPAVSFNYTNVSFSDMAPLPFGFLEDARISDAGFELSVPVIIRSVRNLSNVALFLEPSIRQYDFYTEVLVKDIGTADQMYNDFSIKWLSLGLTTGLRYTLPNTQPSVSLQSGFRLDFLLDREVSLTREQILIRDDITHSTRTEVEPFLLADNQPGVSSQINISRQLGSSAKRWECSLGYFLGRGIAKSDATTVDISFPIKSITHTFFLKTSLLW